MLPTTAIHLYEYEILKCKHRLRVYEIERELEVMFFSRWICLTLYRLTVLMLFTCTVAPEEDKFYILLSRLEEDSISGSGDSDRNSTDDDDTCAVGNSATLGTLAQKNLKCLCGNTLINSWEDYEKKLEASCDFYSMTNESHPLSFCNTTLHNMGFNITLKNLTGETSSDNSSDIHAFNNSKLMDKKIELESYLRAFKRVLDRTIVGVLIRSNLSRCTCFVSTFHKF